MSNLLVSKSGSVTRVTLNKPPLNIVDLELMQELQTALDEIRADATVKVLVLAAEGKYFSAGVDVRDHIPDRVEALLREFHAVIRRLWSFELPTLAAVQGDALGGGCELALACDFIVASEAAQFGQPEIRIGAFPPIAALLLARLIPPKKAFELILTGDPITAATAERLGLVNIVAHKGEFDAAVGAFAARLLKSSGAILRLAKRAALVPLREETQATLREIEELYLRELMSTEDAREGVAAFLEKRPPVWREK